MNEERFVQCEVLEEENIFELRRKINEILNIEGVEYVDLKYKPVALINKKNFKDSLVMHCATLLYTRPVKW